MYKDITQQLNDFLDEFNYCGSRFTSIVVADNCSKFNLAELPDDYLVICDDNLKKAAAAVFPKSRIRSLGDAVLADISLAEGLMLDCRDNTLIAFGSGTINDLCKYASSKMGMDYWLMPTAASMNGYLSSSASLRVAGLSKSFKAHLPKFVFVDLSIIMNAPDRLLYSGLGDLFCSINTHAEWRLASLYTENGFNQELVNILEQLEDEFINGFVVGDENLENLADLIKLIFYSGLVMTVTGSSGSASQSEHIFVHGFDLLYPEIGGKLLHGEKVAFFTHFSLKIWSRLLEEEGLFGQLNTNNYAAALDKILCVHPIYREEMDRIKDIKLLQLREIKKIMYDKKNFLA